jgi:hypothetical protein
MIRSIVLALIAVSTAFAEPRTWTDPTGRYRVQAELLNADAETAQLKIPPDRLKTVLLERLSEADRDYILHWLEDRQRKLGAAKGTLASTADLSGGEDESNPSDGFVYARPSGTRYLNKWCTLQFKAQS